MIPSDVAPEICASMAEAIMPVTPSPPFAADSVLARAMMMCRLALLQAAVEVVRGRRGLVG